MVLRERRGGEPQPIGELVDPALDALLGPNWRASGRSEKRVREQAGASKPKPPATQLLFRWPQA